MSHMTSTQRAQIERYDLQSGAGHRLTSLSERGRRTLIAFSAVLVAVLGVLTYAALEVFDGWHHLIVLGDLAILTLGVAAWVYPQRKHV